MDWRGLAFGCTAIISQSRRREWPPLILPHLCFFEPRKRRSSGIFSCAPRKPCYGGLCKSVVIMGRHNLQDLLLLFMRKPWVLVWILTLLSMYVPVNFYLFIILWQSSHYITCCLHTCWIMYVCMLNWICMFDCSILYTVCSNRVNRSPTYRPNELFEHLNF